MHSSSCHVEGCFPLISKWRWGAFFLLPREGELLSSNFKMEEGTPSSSFHVEEGSCSLLISKYRWSAFLIATWWRVAFF